MKKIRYNKEKSLLLNLLAEYVRIKVLRKSTKEFVDYYNQQDCMYWLRVAAQKDSNREGSYGINYLLEMVSKNPKTTHEWCCLWMNVFFSAEEKIRSGKGHKMTFTTTPTKSLLRRFKKDKKFNPRIWDSFARFLNNKNNPAKAANYNIVIIINTLLASGMSKKDVYHWIKPIFIAEFYRQNKKYTKKRPVKTNLNSSFIISSGMTPIEIRKGSFENYKVEFSL